MVALRPLPTTTQSSHSRSSTGIGSVLCTSYLVLLDQYQAGGPDVAGVMETWFSRAPNNSGRIPETSSPLDTISATLSTDAKPWPPKPRKILKTVGTASKNHKEITAGNRAAASRRGTTRAWARMTRWT